MNNSVDIATYIPILQNKLDYFNKNNDEFQELETTFKELFPILSDICFFFATHFYINKCKVLDKQKVKEEEKKRSEFEDNTNQMNNQIPPGFESDG